MKESVVRPRFRTQKKKKMAAPSGRRIPLLRFYVPYKKDIRIPVCVYSDFWQRGARCGIEEYGPPIESRGSMDRWIDGSMKHHFPRDELPRRGRRARRQDTRARRPPPSNRVAAPSSLLRGASDPADRCTDGPSNRAARRGGAGRGGVFRPRGAPFFERRPWGYPTDRRPQKFFIFHF